MNDQEHNLALCAAHELYKASVTKEFDEYVAAINAAHKMYEDAVENVDEAKELMAKWINEAGAAYDKTPAVVKARKVFWETVVTAREMYGKS